MGDLINMAAAANKVRIKKHVQAMNQSNEELEKCIQSFYLTGFFYGLWLTKFYSHLLNFDNEGV